MCYTNDRYKIVNALQLDENFFTPVSILVCTSINQILFPNIFPLYSSHDFHNKFNY